MLLVSKHNSENWRRTLIGRPEILATGSVQFHVQSLDVQCMLDGLQDQVRQLTAHRDQLQQAFYARQVRKYHHV
jgi:hypothetical protein